MHVRKNKSKGFTLVELLVVIGIIALLISILLPALSQARASAMSVKCMANERSIGQAIMLYGQANKGVILPSMVWNAGDPNNPDFWGHNLVASRLVPDPRIMSSDSTASQSGVLVCPSIRSQLIVQDSTAPVIGTTPGQDGFERRYSRWYMPNTLSPTPEPVGNGSFSKGALIVDFGYGINGTSGNATNLWDVPMQAFSGISTISPPRVKRFTNFRYPTNTVLLFDGSGWNPWNNLWRIVGRHGHRNAKKVLATDPNVNLSGICNILFLDGHVEGIPRADLPVAYTQITGNASQMINSKNKLYWNQKQQ